MKGLAGILLFSLVMAAAISAVIGFGFAWVLSFFGVHVPWYVCSVAVFLIGTVIKSGSK